MYYLYAIGTKKMLVPPYDCCYVGVTNNLDKRWSRHKYSKYTVGQFIREKNLTLDENMIVLYEGDEEECFDLEAAYRPLPYIGLNEASGGRGGHTIYTDKRARKISEAHKGVKKSEEHVENMRKALVESGVRKGARNSRAKKWSLTSPDGMIYTIHGNLTETCQRLNLLESALRYNKGRAVPEPNMNGYGGFRAKSKESLEMRMNTTGWTLAEVPKHSGGV
jgi:hypothetical protein